MCIGLLGGCDSWEYNEKEIERSLNQSRRNKPSVLMPVVGYVNDIIYMFGQISYHVADVIVILATRVDGELREICLRLGIVPGCGSRSL
jgi:hypothetical protein